MNCKVILCPCSCIIYNAPVHNRPFYRFGGHTESIRFKEHYRMPRGHEQIPPALPSAPRDTFLLKPSQNKIAMGKTIFVPCLDVLMIAFFPRFIRVNDYISNTKIEKNAIFITSKHDTRIFSPTTIPL